MKQLFIIICFTWAITAQAEPVSINFSEVRLVDFVRVLYSDIVKKSFVLDGDLLKSEEVITLNLRNVQRGQVETQVKKLLDAQGFQIVESSGVVQIGKKPEKVDPEKTVFVYRPRFRSVTYLQDILSGLFPRGSFSGQRQIAQTPVQAINKDGASVQPQGVKQTSSVAKAQVLDTGTNAYSLLDKSQQDTLVFLGEPGDVKKLSELLVQLDQPSAELVVKAIVYEVRTEQNQGSAVTLAASILSGKIGIAIDGGAVPGNALKLKFSSLDAVYTALSGDKRFKLVSSPTMRVKSGANARFVAGSEVPVLGAITYQSQGQAVQNVEYKSSGVILDLKPQVREDTTDLTIFQQISSFVPTTTGVNQSPTLLKRELQTQVSAKADEMIVLGGLEENQGTQSEQGLSFLPKFLRASGDDQTKTEIMVVLHVQRI